MTKCKWCNESFSNKIMKIHINMCKNRFQVDTKTSKLNKKDLIVFILSSSDDYTEDELMLLLKKDLTEIANKLK